MRHFRISFLGAMAFSVACVSERKDLSAEDVIEISACPTDAGTCDPVADGRSRVNIRVCVATSVASPRADDIVTLSLSAGHWDTSDSGSRTTTASLKVDRCYAPTLITPNDALSVRVDAELVGFRRSLIVPLRPTPIIDIEILATATLKAGQENSVQFRARAGGSGLVTLGTEAQFAIASAVDGSVFPDRTDWNEKGEAAVHISAAKNATAVELVVRALPPAGAQPFEKTFKLPVIAP